MTGRSFAEIAIFVSGVTAAAAAGVLAGTAGGPYGQGFAVDRHVKRVIDPADPTMRVVITDTDSDLVFDTWNYIQDGRVVRIDFDDDQDGRIDRRRYLNADGSVQRTESLASNTGN